MDPFSITGSAVGVISLGLTVCQGLVKYYQSWKDCPDDIKAMADSIENLMESLRLIDHQLKSGHLKPDLVSQVETSIKSCQDKMLDLNNELEKLKEEAGSGKLKQKLSIQSRRLQYPFKQPTIQRLGEKVSGLRGNISVALDALQIHTSTVILEKTKSVGDGVDLLTKTAIDEKKQKIFNWLNPPDPSSNYYDAHEKRQKNTGKWFLGGAEYSAWKQMPNSILWLYGIPGCGKTILSSSIIADVAACYRQIPRIAFFYFSFGDKSKQSPGLFLSSLLKQLSAQAPETPQVLIDLYSRHNNGQQSPSIKDLMQTLREVINDAGQTYIIVDALDECDEWEKLLEVIEQVYQWNIGNLHLLVTSRREKIIEDTFHGFVESQVCLQTKHVDNDIGLLVREQLQTDRRLQRWPTESKRKIEQKLVDGANGMFRWVVCQLDELRKCRNVKSLDQTLNSLPKTLDDTYERILLNISENDRQDALTILKWLAFSARPVLLEEIAEALTIDLESKYPQYDDTRRYIDPLDILEICSTFVTTSTISGPELEFPPYFYPDLGVEKRVVSLAHFSVKEYLLSRRIRQGKVSEFSIDKVCANQCITECCIIYLLRPVPPPGKDDRYPFIERERPLLKYAARYWPDHARIVEDKSNIMRLILDLFQSQYQYALATDIYFFEVNENPIPPLCFASEAGLACTVGVLLENGADVNLGGGPGPPLYLTARNGNEKISQILLEHGADVDIQGGWSGSPLQAASLHANEEIIKLLLEHGADVNIQGGGSGSPLQAASLHANEEIIKLLLEYGADMNIQGGEYGSALEAASCMGNEEIVKLLLKHGADVNAQGGFGGALQAASSEGHEGTVKLLLEHEADVNIQGGKFGSALQAASLHANEDVVKLLLEYEADVNIQGGEFGSALVAASYKGHEGTVKLLLEYGSDVNIQGGKYGTALWIALWGEHRSIVRMLLEYGADPNLGGGQLPFGLVEEGWLAEETKEADRLLEECLAEVAGTSRNLDVGSSAAS
ncbi:hypothetical protein FQN53_000582 [Emmonsiellopsis sp. PD_33]|nr:hypothetical protein FQN53_000582 [Emmonsiellopsis sp. PD_33]